MKNEKIYRPLACKVLAVASINKTDEDELFDWAVYIDSVEGNNHDNEYLEVAKSGTKLNIKIAAAIFPSFPIERYRT